jgi:hypothetical protein
MNTTRTTTSQALRLLLVTPEVQLMTTFEQACKELGIRAEWNDHLDCLPEVLTRAKYEGIVLDLNSVRDIPVALAQVRESRSNSTAVVLAVVTLIGEAVQALDSRAHFLVHRPLTLTAVRETLEAAAILMQGERRRYFRHTTMLPVQIKRENGSGVECCTINVSSSGLALVTPVPLRLGELVDVSLRLPHGATLRTTAIVIWDDSHGKSGLHFHDYTPDKRAELDSWLDACEVETRSA